MKTIVEWGRPKAVCSHRPCGVSADFPVDNPTQACKLAARLFHTLNDGGDAYYEDMWRVTPQEPRKVVWTKDRTAWVAVSLLDGTARGAFAAQADGEYASGHFSGT
jgi:hypothetical protein